MDQVKEHRNAWLYNPGQRRVRRAPNVAYDNPGVGSDGMRTNDQFDMFNGALDRFQAFIMVRVCGENSGGIRERIQNGFTRCHS